jgi:hypothetical protein
LQTGVEQQWRYLLGLLDDVSGRRSGREGTNTDDPETYRDPDQWEAYDEDEASRYPELKAYCYFERGRAPENWVLDDPGGTGHAGLAALAILGASHPFSVVTDWQRSRR